MEHVGIQQESHNIRGTEYRLLAVGTADGAESKTLLKETEENFSIGRCPRTPVSGGIEMSREMSSKDTLIIIFWFSVSHYEQRK